MRTACPMEGQVRGMAMLLLYDFKGNLQINLFLHFLHPFRSAIYPELYWKTHKTSYKSGPKARDALTTNLQCHASSNPLALRNSCPWQLKVCECPPKPSYSPRVSPRKREMWIKVSSAEEENKSTFRIRALILMEKNRFHDQVQRVIHTKLFERNFYMPTFLQSGWRHLLTSLDQALVLWRRKEYQIQPVLCMSNA